MAKKDHAEIAVLIDRSGSMSGLEGVVRKGFTTFLWQQVCAPGTANMTLVLFDDEYDLVHNGEDVRNIPVLDEKTYYVRGGTALYDALGKTITELAARIARMDESERPEKVIVATTTDGYENQSREWDAADLRRLIESKEKDGWEFMYISCIEDDEQATEIGFKPQNISYYEKDEDGTFKSYLEMGSTMIGYRGGHNG
jgi:uncharacterized protein YegL